MTISTASILRHADPFLFARQFRPLDDDSGIEVTYRYTGDEAFFAGHFPGDPVVPGVLLVEAMAQAARLALIWKVDDLSFGNLVAVNRARFNHIVRPPDQVRFVARVMAPPVAGGRFFDASCSAFVGSARAARADLTLSIRPPNADETAAFWPGRQACLAGLGLGQHPERAGVPVMA